MLLSVGMKNITSVEENVGGIVVLTGGKKFKNPEKKCPVPFESVCTSL